MAWATPCVDFSLMQKLKSLIKDLLKELPIAHYLYKLELSIGQTVIEIAHNPPTLEIVMRAKIKQFLITFLMLGTMFHCLFG